MILDTNIHKQPTPITNKLTILGSFDDDFDFNDEEVDTNDGDDQSDDVGRNNQMLADAAAALRNGARRTNVEGTKAEEEEDTQSPDYTENPALNGTKAEEEEDTQSPDYTENPALNETELNEKPFPNITINPILRPVLRTNLFTFILIEDKSMARGEFIVVDVRLSINNFTKSSELFSIYGTDNDFRKFSIVFIETDFLSSAHMHYLLLFKYFLFKEYVQRNKITQSCQD